LTEILFYHLEQRLLEDALPALIERTRQRGWKAYVRCESAERAAVLDRLLWSHDEQGFLPHGLASEPNPARQPVLIGVDEAMANAPDVLFVVGGADAPAWDGAPAKALTRIVLMFDGRDPSALQAAREAWKGAKAAGLEVTYWKETPSGKWEKQGT
jgi:DNA polymerase III subunit chi